MAVHYRIGTASNVLKTLQDQIVDYNNYQNNCLKVIGYPGHKHSDCPVQDFFTYGQWLEQYHQYPVIKVEGLEQLALVRNQFKRFNPKSIHLFVNQKFGYSFNWHRDNVNVLLYVLSGKKTLHLENRVFDIFPGQYAVIPRGRSHRVSSTANTWALSVGY